MAETNPYEPAPYVLIDHSLFDTSYELWFLNSMIIAILAAGISMFVAACAALSWSRHWGRRSSSTSTSTPRSWSPRTPSCWRRTPTPRTCPTSTTRPSSSRRSRPAPGCGRVTRSRSWWTPSGCTSSTCRPVTRSAADLAWRSLARGWSPIRTRCFTCTVGRSGFVGTIRRLETARCTWLEGPEGVLMFGREPGFGWLTTPVSR